jgi:transposase
LYIWRKEYEEFGQGSLFLDGNLKQVPDYKKIETLERKVKDAELKRDILKKTMASFPKTIDDLQFIKNNEQLFPI